MIEIDRLRAIMRDHNLNATALGKRINVDHSKMSKVMSGQQKLSAEAVGELIKEFRIHPNWLFGYEGDTEEVMYLEELIPKKELEEQEKKIIELERENASLYRKLAIHLEQQVAEAEEKYKASQKSEKALKNS